MLYKYRGVANFRFLVDILLKNRLYAARYFELNDPMEGHYLYQGKRNLDEDVERMLNERKQRIRIVSLSRDPANILMWAHYAEGHRGVAIGVDPLETSQRILRPIQYDGLHQIHSAVFSSTTAIEILSHKLVAWNYEQEERIFVLDNSHFAPVRVREVVLGRSMSNQDIGFISEITRKLNPGVEVKRAAEILGS